GCRSSRVSLHGHMRPGAATRHRRGSPLIRQLQSMQRKSIMTHMTKMPIATAGLVAAQTSTAAATRTPQLDPSTPAFVDGLAGAAPLYTLTPHDARAVLSDIQKSVKVDLLDVSRKDRILMVGPDGATNIRVIRPAGSEGELLPVVVYIHGGGW